MASAAKTEAPLWISHPGSDRDGAEVSWVGWQGCNSDWVPPFHHDAVGAVKSGWIS